MDIEKRHENMPLFRNYSYDIYPKYNNYDAIEVGRTADIPCNYFGVIGVPITFMDKYSPEQIEVVGITTNDKENLWEIKTRTYPKADAENYTILNAASVLKVGNKLKAIEQR
ncbi:adenine-specific methyltransferase EcoRI family protein [Caproicibacterium sp. NSD3]